MGCKFACHTDTHVWPWGFVLRSEKCLQMTRFICCLPFLFAILHQEVFPSIFQLIDGIPATCNKVFCVESRLMETFFRNTALLVLQSGQGEETSTQITNTENQVGRETQKFQEVGRRGRFPVS